MDIVRTMKTWIVVVALPLAACGSDPEDSSGDEGTTTAPVSSSSTTSATTPNCEDTPRVAVSLQNNVGGSVYATVEYSVAGGPRVPATDCYQGACFIYAGAEQPIQVFARYMDCPWESLDTFGPACDAENPAQLAFAFYETCSPLDTDTDGDTDGGGTSGG